MSLPKPKRLLIAAEIFPPRIGGPATYTATLARELPPRGWQVTVLCYGETVAGEYPASTTVIAVPRRGGPVVRYARYFFMLWRLAKDFPLIYAQGPVSSGLPALIVAKLRRKKLVVKVTGDYAWEQAFRVGATKVYIEEFQRQRIGGKHGILRWIEQKVCRNANRVVAPSEFLKKIVSGWGVAEDTITVVYNAVSFPVQTDDRQKLRQQFGLAPEAMVVVSAGRPVPWKGFGVLGRAVTELRAAGRNIQLVCIGVTDDELRAMMAQAQAPPVPAGDDRIRGLGIIDRTRLLAWLQAADCFVLNSAYEGLSHLILEAMHAGVPVITTDVGGNRELVVPNQTGLLVPYNDVAQLKAAIVKLADDPTLARHWGGPGARKLLPFLLDFMLDTTEKYLMSV